MLFHALTFVGSRGSCLNTRQIGRVLKHLPRDPASDNAMKQAYVSLFLHILPYSNKIHTENAFKTLTYPFSYTWYL